MFCESKKRPNQGFNFPPVLFLLGYPVWMAQLAYEYGTHAFKKFVELFRRLPDYVDEFLDFCAAYGF